ncbi:DUF4381 domain-containing protein [Bradyrhizobium stylosanthis]|uniref:DUF4381 domain-containing protein n=1 Tax=Bradyrhizobium stylosanthis TaxID=1803665 RepID=UPI0007C42C01|nr:DUF4381 domain-containing protein [Bradyrhizobium stylosanthis]
MADTSPTADPVAGLIDIPLPRETSLWPATWPARIAAVALLAATIVVLCQFVHHRRANRYRREALAELGRIGRLPQGSKQGFLTELTLLVRRTALAAFPREQVAPLFGPAWLAFLDRSYGGQEFSRGVGSLLVTGPYQQTSPTDAEVKSLAALVRRWIRRHHA